MKALKKIVVLTLVGVALVACKNTSEPEVKTVETSTTENSVDIAKDDLAYAKAEFTIEGMTCAVGCAKTIEKKLAKLDGVKSAKVDYENKHAVVEFDDSKLNTDKLEETVTKVADIYTVHDMKTVDTFEAKGNMKKSCVTDCSKDCCKGKTEAEKKACAEACEKACCAEKKDDA